MLRIQPAASPLVGAVDVPGDKSVTHRSLLFASFAHGVTEIHDPGLGEDNIATLHALNALGVEATHDSPRHFTVRGRGPEGFRTPEGPIDCMNSGTTARLLSGLLAGLGIEAELTGDASLRSRPMRRVADPLRDLGFDVGVGDDGRMPIRVHATPSPREAEPVRAVLRIASAQVKSCLMLSRLFAKAETEIVEPAVSRDHSERLLRAFGVRCESSPHYRQPVAMANDETLPWVRLWPAETLRSRVLHIPGDTSSSAFWVAAGLVTGGLVTVRNVGINPTRAAYLDVLRRMGARVDLRNRRQLSTGEPVADIEVQGGSLTGTVVEGAEIPLVIDELPILAVIAARCTGAFEIRNAEELRVKESDRIARMVALLRALGLQVEERPDGLIAEGSAGAAWTPGAFVAGGDHRIAMSAVVASLGCTGESTLDDEACIAVSYPTFLEELARLGAGLTPA
jgi:3-phosphoshikimate 1-carboxyvinyltransferase